MSGAAASLGRTGVRCTKKRADTDLLSITRSLLRVDLPDMGGPKKSRKIVFTVAGKGAAVVGALGAIAGGVYKAWPYIERLFN